MRPRHRLLRAVSLLALAGAACGAAAEGNERGALLERIIEISQRFIANLAESPEWREFVAYVG
ncbi:MAG: hypothetical protein LOD94_01620 [Gammaproteobacteria bacterium]|nr:hypothetical protein [Gammaproteobacteria bacterium]